MSEPERESQFKKFLPYVKGLLREEVNDNLKNYAHRLPPITNPYEPKFVYLSQLTIFPASLALYHQTTYQRTPSKLRFLGFVILSYGLSTAYGRALFETPEQRAQQLNLDREKRHQYALAFIKKGQGLEKEIQRRTEGND